MTNVKKIKEIFLLFKRSRPTPRLIPPPIQRIPMFLSRD